MIILGLDFAKTWIVTNIPFIGISWIPAYFKGLLAMFCLRFLDKNNLVFYRFFGLQKVSNFCSNSSISK